MSQFEPKKRSEYNVVGRKPRRRKVIELKAQGYTIDEIAEKLKVSNSTVDRDLKSADVQAFLDALVQRQIADIEGSKPTARLRWRSDLLDKLLPRKPSDKVEVNVNQTNSLSRDLEQIVQFSRNQETEKEQDGEQS